MRRPRVEIVVDELVLHGFETRDRHGVARGLEGELTRLFTSNVPTDDRSASHIDAGSVTLLPGGDAPDAGIELARAVHRGVVTV